MNCELKCIESKLSPALSLNDYIVFAFEMWFEQRPVNCNL